MNYMLQENNSIFFKSNNLQRNKIALFEKPVKELKFIISISDL